MNFKEEFRILFKARKLESEGMLLNAIKMYTSGLNLAEPVYSPRKNVNECFVTMIYERCLCFLQLNSLDQNHEWAERALLDLNYLIHIDPLLSFCYIKMAEIYEKRLHQVDSSLKIIQIGINNLKDCGIDNFDFFDPLIVAQKYYHSLVDCNNKIIKVIDCLHIWEAIGLTKLNTDVLTVIFSYLDQGDILNCLCVSHEWNRLILSLSIIFQNIYLRSNINLFQFKCFLAFIKTNEIDHRNHFKNFRISFSDNLVFELFLETKFQVECLEINILDRDATTSINLMLNYSAFLGNLSSLSISVEFFEPFNHCVHNLVKSCPNLLSLRIEVIRIYTCGKNILSNVVDEKQIISVRALSIACSSADVSSSDFFKAFFKQLNFPNLEKLYLRKISLNIIDILIKTPKLKYFDQIYPAGLELDSMLMNWIHDEECSEIIPNLRHFCFIGEPNIHHYQFRALRIKDMLATIQFERLKSLRLENTFISEEDVNHILQNSNGRLERLILCKAGF